MIEYKGYKIFEIDFGGQDYIVAKNISEAVRYWLEMVGDDYEKDGFSVGLVVKDFIIDRRELGKENVLASAILKEEINKKLKSGVKIEPFYIATSAF
jgi:uncharacterized protein YeeX (DUF496 family)